MKDWRAASHCPFLDIFRVFQRISVKLVSCQSNKYDIFAMILKTSCISSKIRCRRFSWIDYLSSSFYMCTSVDKCWKLLNVQNKSFSSPYNYAFSYIVISFLQLALQISGTKSSVSSWYEAGIWTFLKYTHIPHTACFLFLSAWAFTSI